MSISQVPVTIPTEVSDYVDQLGLRAQFDEIVDKIPEILPEALSIACEFDAGVPDEEDPRIILNVDTPDEGLSNPTPHMRWMNWAAKRFPAKVLMNFVVVV
jgi:hypothetical protein